MSLKSTNELITALRSSGALNYPTISIGGKAIYFDNAFIRKCIAEIVKKEIMAAVDPDAALNPLELLAVHVLTESLIPEKLNTPVDTEQ